MIEFIYKSKTRTFIPECEVRVVRRSNHSKSGAETYEATFYNYSWKKAFGDSEYGIMGTDGERIYFSKANASNGYKLYQPTCQSKSVRIIRITDKTHKMKSCAGDLILDNANGLYFIEEENG